MNDSHTPIGSQRIDRWFLETCNPDKLEQTQGIADPSRKIVWWRFQDQSDVYRMIGWNWELDQWLESDIQAQLLVSAVTIGAVLNDLDAYGVLDLQTSIPLDSRFWQGGRITFGAFKTDNMMYLFAGDNAAATIETATTELAPETGAFAWGAKLKGDASNYSMQVGKTTLPDSSLAWSGSSMRSARTGMVPFRADAKFHRFRTNIPAGTDWSIVHGVTPFFNQSGSA